MSNIRVVLVSAFVWFCVFTAFAVLSYWSVTRASFPLQASIVGILIVPFAATGSFLYYKNGNTDHGLRIGFIMGAIALLLDVLITVPVVEIPNGRSYESFFTNPVLWILVALNVATVYVYWSFKIAKSDS